MEIVEKQPGKTRAVIDSVVTKCGFVGAISIVLMMFITVTDVVLRYIFIMPLKGSFEITQYLMVISVAMTFAYTAMRDSHVNVDIFIHKLPPHVQTDISGMIFLTSCFFVCLIAWQTAAQAIIIRETGSYSMLLHIPDFIFIWVLFAGYCLLALIFLLNFIDSVNAVLKLKNIDIISMILGSVVLIFLCLTPFYGIDYSAHLNPALFGIVGMVFLALLLFSGMEVGIALALTGFLGMVFLTCCSSGLTLLATVPYRAVASYDLSIIPLFILMGMFAFYSGLGKDIYWTMYTWLGQLPGGLAMASVGACAGFAAISGSSLATSATMGTVALPEMKRYNYSNRLATGCIAAGGTIGILIPPSVILVLYGIITEQSIGELFLAGFIPGVLEAMFYITTIYILCKRNPLLGPPGPKTTLTEKVTSLKGSWGIIVLFVAVMGGIYSGICSPTEAAGIGAFGTFLFTLFRRKLTWTTFYDSIMESGKTACMIFLIMIGAQIFGYFLSVTRLPFNLAGFVTGLQVNRYLILLIIVLVYFFLGCMMDAIAMILITVPIFFPVVTALGFDPLWFGIIIVRMAEIGGLSPPLGMNVFIIKGVAKDVPLKDIFHGIFPFLIADICHVSLLIAIPQISLFLPNLLRYTS
jgi:C4-dicarboxylate transporter DctM subunit